MTVPTRRDGAVFVDRDGVLNHLVERRPGAPPESPLRPRDVRLVEGAAAALAAVRSLGLRVVLVSNQPAAAKGECGVSELLAVHLRVVGLLRAEGAVVDAQRLCLHHPDGPTGPLRRRCECRKPAPGMLLSAAGDLGLDLERSWMVGDSDSDVAAGASAGVSTVLVESEGGAHKRRGGPAPGWTVASITEAVRVIGLVHGRDAVDPARN